MAEGVEERGRRRVGTMVRDKYRIDGFIATGSMGDVYAATHRNGSRVALKILHRDLANDKSLAERFRREGYFANAIGHPGVVRAIDDDVTEDGCAFIVMELLDGESLEQRRRRAGGKIPLPEVLEIGAAMLDVLSAAHDHEVLHRDLKPDNVFITTQNEVKLLDFGVARFNDGRSSSDMTGLGMVLGTPAFMPPEQALGKRAEVDARSDIWGIGATLFTVLTGETVHQGGDAKAKLIATARTPARPLRDVDPSIPRPIARVVDRALAFEKSERWADAGAMREALRWARMSLTNTQLQPPASVPTQPVPKRRPTDDEPTRSLTTDELDHMRAHHAHRDSMSDVVTSAPPQATRTERMGSRQTSPGIGPSAPPSPLPAGTTTQRLETSPYPPPSPYPPSASASASASAPPPPAAHPASQRPSLTPEAPGPLLATIAPKKSGAATRVGLPLAFGIVAGIALYLVVFRAQTTPTSPATATATATASTSVAAAAASVPSTTTAPVPVPSSPPSVFEAPDPAETVAALPSAPSAPKKPRPRPRKPPAAAASTDPVSTAAEPTPEAVPTPAPVPVPEPTPEKDPE